MGKLTLSCVHSSDCLEKTRAAIHCSVLVSVCVCVYNAFVMKDIWHDQSHLAAKILSSHLSGWAREKRGGLSFFSLSHSNSLHNQTHTHTDSETVSRIVLESSFRISVSHQISQMVSEASREALTESSLNRHNTHSPSHTNSASHTNSPSHTSSGTTTAPTATSAAASFFAR